MNIFKSNKKIHCHFVTENINLVPKSKLNEYLKNQRNGNGVGFWTELVTPDKDGYFKNLNNEWFILGTVPQDPSWFKEREPIKVNKVSLLLHIQND